MFTRLLENTLREKLFQGKVLIIIGARQTGKTTLVNDLINNLALKEKTRNFNCDNPTDRRFLNDQDLEFLVNLIGEAKIIFIDEGQKVETIGQTLKLLADHYKKDRQLIVTGSSSINLLDRTEEALTGRKLVYPLFPLSLEELYPDINMTNIIKELENYLIFGSYPEVAAHQSFKNKIELLKELTSSYLYKDILGFQQIKNPDVLTNLLKALALQIGSEVSYNELSNIIGIDKKTIERYIDLLEKNHVIIRISPYTRNKRRELSRLKKIYFYDLGIRNALINNFNFPDSRNDIGALFENFMVIERLKYRTYHAVYANQYFWRTYDGSEVDLVEERAGKLHGYEFKWGNLDKKLHAPVKWLEYPDSSYKVVNINNISGFII